MRAPVAAVLTVLLAGCGTTQVTMVTPWLRLVSHKAASWDSGGAVRTEVEVRRGDRWHEMPGAEDGVAINGGQRVAVRRADGAVVLVSEAGSIQRVRSCTDRAAVVSPDRSRIVCFERGLLPLGFVGDIFYATGSSEQPGDQRLCRLVRVRPNGETTTEVRPGSWAHGCSPALWDSIVDRARLRQGTLL